MSTTRTQTKTRITTNVSILTLTAVAVISLGFAVYSAFFMAGTKQLHQTPQAADSPSVQLASQNATASVNQLQQPLYISTVQRLNDEIQVLHLSTARNSSKTKISLLTSKAKERKEKLEKLLANGGIFFLPQLLFSQELRTALPKAANGFLEKEVSYTGTLEVLYIDDFKQPSDAQLRYFLQLPNKKRLALFFNKPIAFISGSRISIKGTQIGNTVAVFNAQQKNFTILEEPMIETLGEQRTLIILIQHPDEPESTYRISKEQAEKMFFGNEGETVNTYFKETSYNKMWLTGKSTDWTDVENTCDTTGTIEAVDDTVYFPDYSRLVFVYPQSTQFYCSSGFGSIGKWTLQSDDGTFNASISWLNSVHFGSIFVPAHEFGHNIGAHHANGYPCGTQAIDTQNKCSSYEYMDFADIMGYFTAYMQANRKEQFQWFSDNQLFILPQAPTQLTSTISTIQATGSLPSALRIPTRKDGWDYYVEYRTPVGFDKNLYEGYLNGAIIRLAADPIIQSRLIDTTPTNPSTYQDVALYSENIFTDQTFLDDITIKTINIAQDKITVDIKNNYVKFLGDANDDGKVTHADADHIRILGNTVYNRINADVNFDSSINEEDALMIDAVVSGAKPQGDVTGDGNIDTEDFYNLNSFINGDITRFDLPHSLGADVNNDGTINNADKLMLGELVPENSIPITNNTHDEYYPLASNEYIVYYQSSAAGILYAYTLSNGMTAKIAENAGGDFALSGNKVVWRNWLTGALHLYDIPTKQDFELITPVELLKFDFDYPILVYADKRDNKTALYSYAIDTQTEIKITDVSDLYIGDIAISKNNIVWAEIGNEGAVYHFDLETNIKNRIGYSWTQTVDIFEEKVVWSEYINGSYDTVLYNLNTKNKEIIHSVGDQWEIAIWQDKIVWTDYRDVNSNIYLYNLTEKKETQITWNQEYQYMPHVWGNNVVWADNRNGQYDIYMYEIVGSSPPLLPDLSLASITLSRENGTPTSIFLPNEKGIVLTGTVQNSGTIEIDMRNLTYRIFVDEKVVAAFDITTEGEAVLRPGESITFTFNDTLGLLTEDLAPGTHRVKVLIDADDTLPELDESNNTQEQELAIALLGDVNADQVIDVTDSDLIANHINHIQALTPDEQKRADVNMNSRVDRHDWLAVRAVALQEITAEDLPLIVGDADFDGDVDEQDSKLIEQYLQNASYTPLQRLVGDANANNRLDKSDISLFSASSTVQVYYDSLPVLLGDVDQDGQLTFNDSSKIALFIDNPNPPLLKDLLSADLNSNNKIDSSDLLIMQKIQGVFITTQEAMLPPILLADVDDDGVVTVNDAVLAWHYVRGKTTFSLRQQLSAEVYMTSNTGDITWQDVVVILRTAQGKISQQELPFESKNTVQVEPLTSEELEMLEG